MIRFLCVAALMTYAIGSAWAGSLTPPASPAPTVIPGLPAATPITAVPITIDQSGVYYLTDHFTVASTVAHGIVIRADDVVIDMAGYSIVGPGMGTGGGVSAEEAQRVTVRNGTIREFGGLGVRLGAGAIVEDLRIEDGLAGLFLASGGCARRVQVTGAELIGIQAGSGCEVIDCSTVDCGTGIAAIFSSAVTRCTAFFSETDGIVVLGPTPVTECNVLGAQRNGFHGVAGVAFEDCAVLGAGTGFLGEDGVTIRDCTARTSSVEGIAVEGASGSSLIADCHVDDAPIGIRVDQLATVTGNYVNDTPTVAIQISANSVAVLDNVLMSTPFSIQHTGSGVDCFYARNVFTGTVLSYGTMGTFGPTVVGSGDLNDDLDSEHPWANIFH